MRSFIVGGLTTAAFLVAGAMTAWTLAWEILGKPIVRLIALL